MFVLIVILSAVYFIKIAFVCWLYQQANNHSLPKESCVIMFSEKKEKNTGKNIACLFIPVLVQYTQPISGKHWHIHLVMLCVVEVHISHIRANLTFCGLPQTFNISARKILQC
jgi:hypothetical protein